MSDLPDALRLLDDPAYVAFWRERHLCTVTTPRPDGTLHVTPMGIVLDPEHRRAWGVTSRGSVKARNIAAGGEDGVVVAIGSVDARWWASAEGRAVVSDDPEVVAEAESRYAERYRQPRPNPDRVAVRVELTRLLGSVPQLDATRVVQSWHDAVNAGNVRRALMFCSPDVEVGGPQGTGTGSARMEAWLARSRISLEPQEPLVEADGRVVVREHARWRAADAPDGVPTDDPAETWVVFESSGGLLTSVRRYESAADVPAASSLTRSGRRLRPTHSGLVTNSLVLAIAKPQPWARDGLGGTAISSGLVTTSSR